MADKDACIRCHEGTYEQIDREEDFQGRVFLLLECGACKSVVIRKENWDPAEWEKIS